ncbi:MAG: hypothetical protein ACOCXZ_00850 [Chloroflexota bacterium]
MGQIITICGLGVVGCGAFLIGGLLLLLMTGRAIMIPAIVGFVGQLFAGGLDTLRNLFGGDGDIDKERRTGRVFSGEKPDKVDPMPDLNPGGFNAVERIRRKREAYKKKDVFGQPLEEDRRDLARGDEEGGEQRPRWRSGGRRGPIRDRFNTDLPPPPQQGSAGSSRIGNRPGRDSRKREWHEDELFGGAMDDDGDGYPDR